MDIGSKESLLSLNGVLNGSIGEESLLLFTVLSWTIGGSYLGSGAVTLLKLLKFYRLLKVSASWAIVYELNC